MFKSFRNIIKLIGILFLINFKLIPISLIKCWIYKKTNYAKYQESLVILGFKLRELFQSLGPTFIKLGQALSTRSDLVGDKLSQQLTKLQDKLPAFSITYVHKQIMLDFETEIKNLFSEFSLTPVAAGSIAQVHKAKLISGEIVAVKVLRPKIVKHFKQDLELFEFIIDFLEFVLGDRVKRLRLQEVLQTLINLAKFELDLRYEAAASNEIKFNTKDDHDIYIPKIYWDLTSQNILTAEWIDGIPLNDIDALKQSGHNLPEIAQKLSVIFFNQAYRDGFFHADLHPGNLFVQANGNIAMVDFGIIGILSQNDRLYITEILYGFIERDYQRVSDIHFKAGYVPTNQNSKLFALACRSIGEPIIGLPVNQISIALLLKQLFAITKEFNMPTQPQLLMLQKTMVTLEGIGLSIYPQVNMWKLAEPWIKDWVEKNYGIKAKLKYSYKKAADLIKELPAFYDETFKALILHNKRANENELERLSFLKNKPYALLAISFLSGMAFIGLLQLIIG